MPSYLADIIAAHRVRAGADTRPLADLIERAAQAPPPRDFTGALRAEGLSCIAEVKRRSPSKGELDADLEPDLVAKEYAAGGAACISVLTDARVLRWLARRPGVRTSRRQPAGAAQGLHRPGGRRGRRARHGRRRRLVDRGRARRRRAAPFRGTGLRSRAGRSRRSARRRGARARAERGGDPRRGEPARSPDVRGGPRPRPAGWRRASLPRSRRSPSQASGVRRMPRVWPTPATTPSWWGRRWSEPATGPPCCAQLAGHPVAPR